MFGSWVFFSRAQKQQLSFTEHGTFCEEFAEDLQIMAGKTGSYTEQMMREQLSAQLEQKATDFTEKYNETKANFIRGYLFDCLCREDIYENYASYFVVDAEVSVPQVTIEKRVLVDAYAPEFVQKLQKILNGADGTGFLRYSALIPEEVYAAQGYTDSISVNWNGNGRSMDFDYTLDLEDPATYYRRLYNEFVNDISFVDFSAGQSVPESIKYYISDPKTGETFTNMENYTLKQWLSYYKESTVGFSILSGVTAQKGLETALHSGVLDNCFNEALDVYVVLDTSAAPADDKYVQYRNAFEQMAKEQIQLRLVLIAVLSLCSLALLILLLIFTVNRRFWIDKLPLEVHLALSVLAGGACVLLGGEILLWVRDFYFDYISYMTLISWGFQLLAALGWAVVCEFFCCLVRIIKSGEFKNSLLLIAVPQRIYRKCSGFVKHIFAVVSYQPGTMRKYVIPLVVCWAVADALLIFLLLYTRSAGIFLLFMVLQFFGAFKMTDYLQQLDKIILASQKRQEYTGNIAQLPPSLRTLVQSQKYTQDELHNAIEKAIKDERTKAELITNVSHDLKTPLTSVINYIDLLQRCDIPDETAKEYLSVLEDKSARLKRLIEDLIEASKVSTGNITLQKTELSLGELADQAIVEETDGMEEQGLQLIYTNQGQPTVYADGSKIYRVLENLLSNARKYSLPGSRVYASVYEDAHFGFFELKNTSKEPLDIPPEELTGRFVRGDRSRSEEGNGLGLSIAGDLCRLNGGELILSIDGDLFKAIVKLPKF